MTVLHLGVIDIPYAGPSYGPATKNTKIGQAKRGKANAPKASAAQTSVTTGDVAMILEDHYHIMETFFKTREAMIAAVATQSMQDAIDNLVMGAPVTIDPFGDLTNEIEKEFKQFLSLREMDHMGIAGVPTMAALKGVNHRFKHPYAKSNPERPSFIDTGLYQANFKAWVD